MAATLLNLTAHDVHLVVGSSLYTIPPTGIVARCSERTKKMGYADLGGERVALSRVVFERVDNLPPAQKGRFYIVSAAVAAVAVDRSDLLVPNGMVRRGGKVVACRRLAQYGNRKPKP